MPTPDIAQDLATDLGLPREHLLPVDEFGHVWEDCSCKPFVYVRATQDKGPTAYEVRHNAFTALPVDEEALEVAQGRRAALDDAEGHS